MIMVESPIDFDFTLHPLDLQDLYFAVIIGEIVVLWKELPEINSILPLRSDHSEY